jgi:chloride channel 3/4/5
VYSRAAARSGISEMKTILGGFIIKKFLGIRTIFIKSLGSILSVSSGLSVGKMGPLIHIGCCWGNIISRKFTKYNANEVKRREILSAAAAAGVAAAFGAPIGGVLFSMESLSSYFPPLTMWRSFCCSVTAALILQWIDPFQTGKLVQFAVFANANHWNWREMPIFACIGCIGGILGVAFIKFNMKLLTWRRNFKWLRTHPIEDVFILIVVTSIFNYSNFFLRGSQSSLLAQLFTNCRDVSVVDGFTTFDRVTRSLCDLDSYGGNMALLVVAAFTKFVLTSFTYGCNVPSGIFMPVLVIGACIGRVIGWSLDNQHNSMGDVVFFQVVLVKPRVSRLVCMQLLDLQVCSLVLLD